MWAKMENANFKDISDNSAQAGQNSPGQNQQAAQEEPEFNVGEMNKEAMKGLSEEDMKFFMEEGERQKQQHAKEKEEKPEKRIRNFL